MSSSFLALGGSRQRGPAGIDQVGRSEVEVLIDQEILLLGPAVL